jgi:hypothetical protein
MNEIMNEPFLKEWQWGTRQSKEGISQNNTETARAFSLHSIAAEVSVLMGYDTTTLGNLFLTFQDNVVVPSSRVEISKNWVFQHLNYYIVSNC